MIHKIDFTAMDRVGLVLRLLGYILATLWAVIRNKKTYQALAVITFLYLYAWFFSNYYIQSPVKRIEWQCSVCSRVNTRPAEPVKKTKPKAGPIKPNLTASVVAEQLPKTEEEIVKQKKWGHVLWRIYQLETQRGKTDYCRLNGKGWGGFGVTFKNAEGKKEIACYDSFQKAVDRAEYWLIVDGVEKNLANALCIWNIGKNINNCQYYTQYLLVK